MSTVRIPQTESEIDVNSIRLIFAPQPPIIRIVRRKRTFKSCPDKIYSLRKFKSCPNKIKSFRMWPTDTKTTYIVNICCWGNETGTKQLLVGFTSLELRIEGSDST